MKWSIWQIPSPYADLVMQQDGITTLIELCNGIGSSKVYLPNDELTNDDGVAISSSYTTYSFTSATKATTIPMLGLSTKRYTLYQVACEGEGQLATTFLQNSLFAAYPYSIPRGITLDSPCQDDNSRPLNVKGNRVFVEFGMSDNVDGWWEVSKILLTGQADAHSSINPVGGGNLGITRS